MNLGDIVIYGGQRFYVRGLDPAGARPRYLYLENVRTGERLSVAFGRARRSGEPSAGGLHVVHEPPSTIKPEAEPPEPKGS